MAFPAPTGTGYPVAQGVPSNFGTLNPLVFSKKWCLKWYEGSCLTNVTNTDYEGEIKEQGDTLRIRLIPDIDTYPYTKGQPLPVQTPATPYIDLPIDKGVGYNFKDHPLDRKQENMNSINKWLADATESTKGDIEKNVFANVYADAHASNKGATAGAEEACYNLGVTGSPVVLTKDNVLEYITFVDAVLGEQAGIPETDRFLVVPVWMANLIQNSDLKNASLTGDQISPIRTGRLGEIANLTLYKNNRLSKTVDGGANCYNIIGGHPAAVAFATQLTVHERIPDNDDYGHKVRGLQCFGYKTVKPEALVWMYAKRG